MTFVDFDVVKLAEKVLACYGERMLTVLSQKPYSLIKDIYSANLLRGDREGIRKLLMDFS